MALKGIDVSAANGELNWDELKDQIDFAIIRLGIGDDIESQDDTYAYYNMDECERVGLPYGLYLYSYAITDEECDSEISHALRVADGRNPVLGIWFDMEDADGYKERHNFDPYDNAETLTEYCRRFVDAMKDHGYKSGVYANANYWRNIVDYDKFDTDEVWLAIWGPDEPPMDCIMWQYTSDGDGVVCDGSRTDMNYYYGDIDSDVKPHKRDDDDDIKPSSYDVNVYYQVLVEGRWLPVVKNDEDYAGIIGKYIYGLAIKLSNGYAHYRVHDCNGWHAYISTNNTNTDDYYYGYAGDGQPIDAVEVYYFTPDGEPLKKAKYRVSTLENDYYSYQYDNEVSNGQDGYAGVFGNEIDRIQIVIE